MSLKNVSAGEPENLVTLTNKDIKSDVAKFLSKMFSTLEVNSQAHPDPGERPAALNTWMDGCRLTLSSCLR